MQPLTTSISKWLAKEGVILQSDTTLYAYATRCFLFGVSTFLMILFWGALLGCFLESIVFFIPFTLIRKFCGGFHFKNAMKYAFVSFSIIGASVFSMSTMQKTTMPKSLTVLVPITTLSVCILSPVDSAARKLSHREREYFRKIARFLAISTTTLYLIFLWIGETYWAIPIGIGIIVPATLQIPCVLQKALHNLI